jgi:hypothetical protein
MTTISKEDIDALQKLEESLWIAETRYNDEYMEAVFAPDFFEFGCSGRIYQREAMLEIPAQREIKAKLPLEAFQVRSIVENVVQVTYVSEVLYEDIQRCNRSSIWIKTEASWRLRFHQGTPVHQNS